MKIFIGGDFAPTVYNFDLFRSGEAIQLYGEELLEYLDSFDYRIFDFECCFGCGDERKVKKYGPIITAPFETINGIKVIDPSLMILANNHAYNLLDDGLRNTVNVFKDAGIECCGAGENLSEAKKPFIIESKGLRIGIYACAEHEYNYATAQSGGVNPYDPLFSYDDVAELKEGCDYVIVIYHGGLIEYRFPLPGTRKRLRRFVDKGADAVICQHTHCIGVREEYKGKTIVYGQGDFFFARPTRNEYRESGLLIGLEISDAKIKLSYSVRILEGNTVRMATKEESERVLSDYKKRCDIFEDEDAFQAEYERLLVERKNVYLSSLLGKKQDSILYRGLNKITKKRFGEYYRKIIFSPEDWIRLTNFTECETHYEILSDLLKEGWMP